jgi:hypothetical protein
MNIFTYMFYSKEVAFERRYESNKEKIILLYLQLNLMMPTIFLEKNEKCAKLFWVWKFGKTIQYENWFLCYGEITRF